MVFNPRSDEVAAVNDAVNSPVKPGWKTTEFWLSAVAVLVGLAYGSGLIGEGTQVDKVFGLVAGGLTAMGYSVSRGMAKK